MLNRNNRSRQLRAVRQEVEHALSTRAGIGTRVSPRSGTQALAEKRHTHGRRDTARFTDPAKIERLYHHVGDLDIQLLRAVRNNRAEKVAKLADLRSRLIATGTALVEQVAKVVNGPVEHIGSGRVLPDLTAKPYGVIDPATLVKDVWGPRRGRFNREIVNKGKLFIMPD